MTAAWRKITTSQAFGNPSAPAERLKDFLPVVEPSGVGGKGEGDEAAT